MKRSSEQLNVGIADTIVLVVWSVLDIPSLLVIKEFQDRSTQTDIPDRKRPRLKGTQPLYIEGVVRSGGHLHFTQLYES
jgi:hypothetical protein